MATTTQDDSSLLKSVMVLGFLTIALGFSAYQTATGYELDLGKPAAWLLALMCAGILGLLTMSLRSAIRENRSTVGIWIGCLVVSGVSFAGNFNAFYTGFNKGNLIRDELDAKKKKLDSVFVSANLVLADREYLTKENQAKAKMKALRSQILNEGNPGLGPKALVLLTELDALLGRKRNLLVATGSGTAVLTNLADRYEQGVIDDLSALRKISGLNAEERTKTFDEIKQPYKNASDKLDSALKDVSSTSPTGLANAVVAIQEAVMVHNLIGSKTKASIKEADFIYDENLRLEGDKIGKIAHSFDTASKYKGSFAVWLSAFLALFIDMGVPLVIRLVHRTTDYIPQRQAKNRPVTI
jgi:hypothetical protein